MRELALHQRYQQNMTNDNIKDITVKMLDLSIIRPKFACELNAKWHSRLPNIHYSNVVRNKHYICYGFSYSGYYFAVGIWSTPTAANRFADGQRLLELRRLAISQESPKYTATRMLSLMIKDIRKKFPDVIRLVSYQDTEVHTGTIYKAANWQAVHNTKVESWNGKRKRNKDQALSVKVRWEYIL
jgi:hypothetical protein